MYVEGNGTRTYNWCAYYQLCEYSVHRMTNKAIA